MQVRHIANFGLVAAIGVAALSITAVWRGAYDAPALAGIAIGQQVPAVSLVDMVGRAVNVAEPSRDFRVLVYTYTGEIDAGQQVALEQLAGALPTATPVEFVTVAQARPDRLGINVFPYAENRLIDSTGEMAIVLGDSGRQPVVCVIDPSGRLLYRTVFAAESFAGMGRIRDIVTSTPEAMAMSELGN